MKKTVIRKSAVDGKGIFADEDIKAGDVVFSLSGQLIHREMRSERESKRFINWIGVGKNLWINPNRTRLRYFNHSCEPNTAILSARSVVAIKDIKRGEEVTFDYSSTDTDPLWRMKCRCGSKNCRKIIGSVFMLAPEEFQSRVQYILPYCQKAYLRASVSENVLHAHRVHATVR